MKFEVIDSGAEAVVYREDGSLVKERISKPYRHPEIDSKLRKLRTRREAKVLQKLKEIGFPSPALHYFDDKSMKVNMEFLDGEKVRDVLHKDPLKISRQIGEKVALLHNNDIIHYDLTTSNMILKEGKVHLIDFGLSFFSKRPEDMAVDLHLLDRAMESRHHKHYPECFNEALKGYMSAAKKGKEVVERFRQVKLRGRNKNKH